MESIFNWVLSQQAENPLIFFGLSALGSLVILAQAYVAITPTQTDDAWFHALEEKKFIGPLFRALITFAPIQRRLP